MTDTIYGWAIDRDYINGDDLVPEKRVGWGQDGPTRTLRTDLKATQVEEPVRFKLVDGDGEVYYGGAVSKRWVTGAGDLAYGILQWAAGDAGCTDLLFKGDAKELGGVERGDGWVQVYG